MAFRLKRRESVADGVRRVALAQFDGALTDLKRPHRLASIHQTRKRLKMLRAVLRLVRSDVEPAVFDRERTTLRDVGRRLSLVRDADMMLTVVRDLGPERTGPAGFRRVLGHFVRHQRHVRREFFDDDTAIAEVRRTIEEAQARLDEWTAAATANAVVSGMRRSYRRGRRSFRAARRSRNDERWHEWRKRTKDLWYHLRLIEGIWPPVIGAAIVQCKSLSDQLGEDHDLVIVGQRLVDVKPDVVVTRECRRIKMLIERRREKLQDEARAGGLCLFEEKPGEFASRVEACWDEWRN